MSNDDTSRLNLDFTGVYLHSKDLMTLTSETADLSDDDIDHTLLYFMIGSKWYGLKKPDAIVSVCALELSPPNMFFLSANGRVHKRSRGQDSVEVIDQRDDGPSDLLQMKAMRAIGAELYAVGMARRAYKRGADGLWVAIDSTCFVPRAQRKEATGFNSVGGTGPSDIYAVGYKGEIWHYDSQVWEQQSSPTNITLTCLICAADGVVYVAGLSGMLLVGKAGLWEVIPQTKTKDNFWGIADFRGHVYVASQSGLFRIVGNDLEPVSLANDGRPTTSFVDASDGVMWSVGRKDILSTSDGQIWTRVNNP
jgi:hypothetical protein